MTESQRSQSLLDYLQTPADNIKLTNAISVREQFTVPTDKKWYRTRNDLVIEEWKEFTAQTFFTNDKYKAYRDVLKEIKVEQYQEVPIAYSDRSQKEIAQMMSALLEGPINHAMHTFFYKDDKDTTSDYVQRLEGSHTGLWLVAGTEAALKDVKSEDMPTYAFVPIDCSKGHHNRLPGVVQASLHWTSDPTGENYLIVLAQLNDYMEKSKAKYGFILTDKELVAVRRHPRMRFHLSVAQSVPVSASTTSGEEILTVKLAVFWLGLMAANDHEWGAPLPNLTRKV